MLHLPTILDWNILLDAPQTLTDKINHLPWTFRHARQQCKVFGIVAGTRNKRILLTMIEKLPRQPVIYEGFGHQDLVDFTNSRRLKLSKTAQEHLDQYISKRATTVQNSDADGTASHSGQPTPSSDTPSTGSGVLLRRSSRLAAKAAFAASTVVRKRLPSKTPGKTAMPVRGPAAKRVVYKSPGVAQRMEQRSLKAAERLSETSLIRQLEQADRNIQFDFLGLPAEVREMVLRYVCISSATIVHPQQQPAIARTCSLLRSEALALYYGSNRFTVFVGRVKPGVGYKALSDMNSWLHELEPSYLASVRSLSFVHLGASIVLDIDFDIRGQRFGIVRRSTHSPPADKRDLRAHTVEEFRWQLDYSRSLARIMSSVRWGEELHTYYPYTESSSSILTAFKSCVLDRVGQAHSVTVDDKTMSWYRCWRLLSEQWNARKGFSCSSIKEIAEMLVEVESNVEDLWVDDFN
ncbi:hypothetical protein KCU78_g10789, partial [Aureobasidium melanogenum]